MMRTRTRLTGLKQWIEAELCTGREMKTPGADYNLGDIRYAEPSCYLMWTPMRKDAHYDMPQKLESVCPCIIASFQESRAMHMEEKRFDRYNKVSRPKEFGQTLLVDLLFCVYEPGIRLPGFAESVDAGKLDPSLILEGTQEGIFTLTDWMDECLEKLLATEYIPGTDLFVNKENVDYSPYITPEGVVDKRPCYYGFVRVEFYCYANKAINQEVEELLE